MDPYTSLTPESKASTVGSRSHPVRPTIRAGLRWFAAEFLVVLSGVLVALIVNAWWTQRSDIQAERSYLTYLVSDLSQAERNVAHVDSVSHRYDLPVRCSSARTTCRCILRLIR
jgi:hypothetical protein